MKSKEELVNEIAQLQRLQDEAGRDKDYSTLVNALYKELFELLDGENARKKIRFGKWPYGRR